MAIKELIELIISKQPSWDDETNKIVNYLWNAWEADSVELETFRARVAKEWPTKGSNLYTEEEVKKMFDAYRKTFSPNFNDLSPLEQMI